MRFYLFPFCLIGCLAFFAGCSETGQTKQDNAVISGSGNTGFVEIPSWMGTYQDTLSCKDCQGTLTWLDFKKDRTYKKSIILLGKEPVLDYTFGTTGTWKYDSGKNTVWLDPVAEKGKIGFFIVGDSVLTLCDSTGKPKTPSGNQLQRISPRSL